MLERKAKIYKIAIYLKNTYENFFKKYKFQIHSYLLFI